LEELVEEATEVRGKTGILFRVAEAAIGSPDGVVREVIFPVAGESTLEALVREARALGIPQSRRVHTAVRASYGSYLSVSLNEETPSNRPRSFLK
jgi:hypothetical protein